MLSSHETPIEQLVSRRLLSCSPDTPVREAARLMAQARCSAIVVMEAGRAQGIWTERDALAFDPANHELLEHPVSRVMSRPVRTLQGQVSAGEAALRFREAGIRHMLVEDEAGQYLGMLSQTDIVLSQGTEFYLRLKSVGSILGRLPLTLRSDLSLAEGISAMHEVQADAAVIAYPDGTHGILTQRDVVRLLASAQDAVAIGEVCSRPLLSVSQQRSLFATRKFLIEHRFRHVGVHNDEGRLMGLVSFADILSNIEYEYVNELQQALRERDEALFTSRYHLRLADRVFDAAQEGIMVTDAQGVICRVNPAFSRLTGYTAEEVLGHNAKVLSSGRQSPAFYAEMWTTLQTRGFWQGEIWNRRKDGGLYLQHLTISCIPDEADQSRHYAAIFADITQRRQDEERLSHLANHDGLTGLPNRSLFNERLNHALSRAHRRRERVAVMFLDLDRFKPINDTYGHGTGDKLLKTLAERMSRLLREGDTVARLGGDEFTFVLEGLRETRDAAAIAQKLQEVVAAPLDIDGHRLFVTPSIGISIYPDDGDGARQLLLQADCAMYQAKSSGKNNFQFFTADMNSRATERLTIENGLRQALECDEFELHYQPQVDLASGRIAGLEALLRWRHPTSGLLAPGRFMDVAEESALIVPIGEWVLRRACEQGRQWLNEGLDFGRIAVNFSARQLQQRGVVARVLDIVQASGLPFDRLELELTESVAMDSSQQAATLLSELGGNGVSLAIDDFGTGYSSFTYLKRLPVDTLKIDRSLVADLGADPRDAAIVRAIVAMARALDLNVLAEGVEQPEQENFLRQIGCHQAQGYLFARPLPAAQVAVALHQQGLAPIMDCECGA